IRDYPISAPVSWLHRRMPPGVALVRTIAKTAQWSLLPSAIRQSADDFGRLRANQILRALAKSRRKSQSMKLHRGSVFSRPCSWPKYPSHSKVESRAQLPRLAKNSSEPELRSRGRSFSGKLREKLGD